MTGQPLLRQRQRQHHERPARPGRPASVVVVGAGPSGVGVLERLLAHWGGAVGARLDVHLVDPHPAGGGRVWRRAQSALLLANSLVADVTVLPDAATTLTAPAGLTTTLAQWVELVGVRLPAGDPVGKEARRTTPTSFPSRQLVGAYLKWVLGQVVAGAPSGVRVHEHAARAVDLRSPQPVDPGAAPGVVVLDDGTELVADAVVLAQGHLDAAPTAAEQQTAAAAAAAGLTYLPTGYTADVDLSALAPGADVLVRGAGLAFVDLLALVTSGRGGTFARDAAGRLRYTPSGREPVLHVGSRRGVPYRSKLGYAGATAPSPLRFFTPAEVDLRFGPGAQVDLRTDLAPLLAAELAWAHTRHLFTASPERTRGSWEDAAAALAAGDSAGLEAAVPDPADRFDLAALDRPLAGVRAADAEELQALVRAHVRADVERRADPRYAQDAAVFTALLGCHGTVLALSAAGRLTPASAARDVSGWWMNLFNHLASGPPGSRLEELIALSEAGVVRFLGADAAVVLDSGAGCFVATSASSPAVVRAAGLVDARLPDVDVGATTDPLLRRLLGRGLVGEQVLADPGSPGGLRRTGRLHVDAGARAVTGHGPSAAGADPAVPLFAIGVWTSAGPVGAIARPGTNAPAFRRNDAVAAQVVDVLRRREQGPAGRALPHQGSAVAAAS